MATGHTPTPWEVKGIGAHNIYVETVSMKPDGGFICDMQADEVDTPEDRERVEANAQFIVAACNSHDALLAACKAIICEGREGNIPWNHPDHISLNDSVWMCQHAVDEAEGRPLLQRPVGGWTEDDRPG